MMVDMNEKLNNVMEETTDEEKIRLFYELGTYFLGNMDYEELDDNMQELVEEIANVVNVIDNL